jgi:hypothetical protein
MSQVQSQNNPYKPLIMENNYSELACLIGHEALDEGEISEPTFGFEYADEDDRGLPVYIFDKESGKPYVLEGVCL